MADAAVTALRVEKIVRVLTPPIENADLGRFRPAERAARIGLVEAIHSHRIVRGGTAKPIAHSRVADVSERTRIDEDFPVRRPHQHTERIGVAVTRASGTERPAVDDHLTLPIRHDRDAGGREQLRTRLCRSNFDASRTEPPRRLLIEISGIPDPFRAAESTPQVASVARPKPSRAP